MVGNIEAPKRYSTFNICFLSPRVKLKLSISVLDDGLSVKSSTCYCAHLLLVLRHILRRTFGSFIPFCVDLCQLSVRHHTPHITSPQYPRIPHLLQQKSEERHVNGAKVRVDICQSMWRNKDAKRMTKAIPWQRKASSSMHTLNFTFCTVERVSKLELPHSPPHTTCTFISYRPLARFHFKRYHSQTLGWDFLSSLPEVSDVSFFPEKDCRTKMVTEISSSNGSDKYRHGNRSLSVWGSWCLWSFALVACWFSTSCCSWTILAWYHGWSTSDLRRYQKLWCSDDWFSPWCFEDHPMIISG